MPHQSRATLISIRYMPLYFNRFVWNSMMFSFYKLWLRCILSQRSGYVNIVIKTGKHNSRHRFIISVSNRLVHRINMRFKMSCHQKFVLLVLDRTHPHYYHVCNTVIVCEPFLWNFLNHINNNNNKKSDLNSKNKVMEVRFTGK